MGFDIKNISDDYFFDGAVVRVVETTDGKFFWQHYDVLEDTYLPRMTDVESDDMFDSLNEALEDAEGFYDNNDTWGI